MIFVTSKHSALFTLYGVFLSVIFLCGCSNEKQYELRATESSAASAGTVTVSEDNLGNTTLDIEVENLENRNTTGARNYYVAWAVNEGDAERLGQLNIDNHQGELIAITEMEKFAVMITSEKFPDGSQPSKATVLKSKPITVE